MDKISRWVMATMVVVVLVVSGPTPGKAATLNVPGSYATIQDAIDNAGAGDTVLVADGFYVENIDFSGKAITVRSENGPGTTTISGGGLTETVHFGSDEGLDSVLDGFTITDGQGGPAAGIFCYVASPTIINCIISGNIAAQGGGISILDSTPTITNCTITGNETWSGTGGGIYCKDSSPVINNCAINNNSSNGDGGGIFTDRSSLTITNSTIAGNTSTVPFFGSGGGGLCLTAPRTTSAYTITNCTITGNTAGAGTGRWDLFHGGT